MASLLQARSNGNLQVLCAVAPVFVASPSMPLVDRHSRRAAGHRSFSAGDGLHSSAAELLAVGRSTVAPSSLNAKAICHGAAFNGDVISQRSGRCLFVTVLGAARQFPANPPIEWGAVKATFFRAIRLAWRPLLLLDIRASDLHAF